VFNFLFLFDLPVENIDWGLVRKPFFYLILPRKKPKISHMKPKIKCFVCSAVMLLSFYSCEFSPSEIPLTELEQPSEDNIPAIWVELTPEMDTLRLSAPTWITYGVETDEHQVYAIKIYLDNAEIGDASYLSQKKSASAYSN